MSKDILKLNGTSAWLASVVTTKSMLCGFRKWRDVSPKLKSIWTVKMINRWHDITLQEMENKLLDDGEFWSQLPLWAKEIFNHRTLTKIEELENRNKATELHTVLLVAASQLLLNIARRGAGKHNTSQIKLWFESLKSAKSLSLFNQATKSTTNSLYAIMSQYYSSERRAIMTQHNSPEHRTAQENGENKLYHDMLLIHIAHMVNFACASNPQGNQRKVNCSHEDYRSWSTIAGYWHATHLKLGFPGSCIGDVNISVKKDFAMIEVPTDQLFCYHEQSECPNVLALHREILDRMAAAIEQSKFENPDENEVGSCQFF